MQVSKVPEKLVVKVTRDHISRGIQHSPLFCPIALAIKEQYGDEPSVSSIVRVTFNDELTYYKTSWRAAWFIYRFDSKGHNRVRPQTLKFRLERQF